MTPDGNRYLWSTHASQSVWRIQRHAWPTQQPRPIAAHWNSIRRESDGLRQSFDAGRPRHQAQAHRQSQKRVAWSHTRDHPTPPGPAHRAKSEACRLSANALTAQQADHAILELYRKDVINLQRVGAVVNAWENRRTRGATGRHGDFSMPPPTPSKAVWRKTQVHSATPFRDRWRMPSDPLTFLPRVQRGIAFSMPAFSKAFRGGSALKFAKRRWFYFARIALRTRKKQPRQRLRGIKRGSRPRLDLFTAHRGAWWV